MLLQKCDGVFVRPAIQQLNWSVFSTKVCIIEVAYSRYQRMRYEHVNETDKVIYQAFILKQIN